MNAPHGENRNPKEFWEVLTDFLDDVEGQTTEEIKEDLRAEGIDVNGLVQNVKQMIDVRLRQSALDEARERRLKLAGTIQKVLSLPEDLKNASRDVLLGLLRELGGGQGALPSGVHFRNIQNLSDDELRAIIAEERLLEQLEEDPIEKTDAL